MPKNLIIVVLLFFSSFIFAQKGTLLTETMKSEILKRDMSHTVYLPPSYNQSNRTYPVLYLLHGMTDDHTSWVLKGDAGDVTDEAIAAGKISELIIIMPDGLFDAFYINNYDMSIMWEDYFHKEFIPAIEKKYRIATNKKFRSIAGLSMGGYGSTYHALKYKDKFSSCYAMSAAYIELEPLKKGEEPPAGGFENTFVKLWGPRDTSGLHVNYKKHSIYEMVKAMPEFKSTMFGAPAFPRLTIDCGDDDFLIKQNTNLFHLMKEKKIPFEFLVRDGDHSWPYWRHSLGLALEYIGEGLRNN
jgi:S-formylglutathione hydrolase FrmB